MKTKICDICEKDITRQKIYYYDGLFVCKKCYKRMMQHLRAERKSKKK